MSASEPAAGSPPLCVLLAAFLGRKGATRARRELDKEVRSAGAKILDEVVLTVNVKGKAMVHDPRRTTAGAMTSALTWGLFGLAASGGSWSSLVVWALIGAPCGGIYAYVSEHLLSKSQLKRISERMGPDTSALAIWAEAADAERLLSATAPLQPATASVAAIADDLSATVFVDAANPGKTSTTGTNVLSMLLLRFPGEHTARQMVAKAGKRGDDAPQVELVFESAKSGKRRVISPSQGVAATAKSDVVSWGGFGLVFVLGPTSFRGLRSARVLGRCPCSSAPSKR